MLSKFPACNVTIVLVAILASFCVTRPTFGAATTGITMPYLQVSDSPLVTSSPGFRLETFEPTSPTLLSLGVNLTTLHGSSVDPGFSVDADDGNIDGSGAAGHSLTVVTQAGTSGATFTFNNVTLGGYPKSAAVAFTAGSAGNLTFTAYDVTNAVSGTYIIPSVNNFGPTSQDFLFWASDASGISAISVTSNVAATALHLDHVQFDTINTISVPEPGSLLSVATVAGLLFKRRGK